MDKKHRKWAEEQHRAGHDKSPSTRTEDETAAVYTVDIQPHPDEKERYAKDQRDRKNHLDATKNTNIISGIGVGIAVLTLISLIVYAYITFEQLKEFRKSNEINKAAFDRAYRPYIGIERFETDYGYEGADRMIHFTPGPTRQSNVFDYRIVVKNYGAVPGTNYRGDHRAFVGGKELPYGLKVPDRTFTFYPGQFVKLAASFRRETVQLIMSGKSTLTTEVTVEYDGPGGHYKECTKNQFDPKGAQFFNLGPCDH